MCFNLEKMATQLNLPCYRSRFLSLGPHLHLELFFGKKDLILSFFKYIFIKFLEFHICIQSILITFTFIPSPKAYQIHPTPIFTRHFVCTHVQIDRQTDGERYRYIPLNSTCAAIHRHGAIYWSKAHLPGPHLKNKASKQTNKNLSILSILQKPSTASSSQFSYFSQSEIFRRSCYFCLTVFYPPHLEPHCICIGHSLSSLCSFLLTILPLRFIFKNLSC